MTNDLRIADAPLLVDVSGEEKIPTGGYGNYSTTINQIADFTQLKWKLATEGYVDNKVSILNTSLNNHISNKTNPHGVTKEQIGLGEVDNTADLDKPVSAYQRTAIDEKIAKTNIVDNLTNSESTKVLSAKQGKILQDNKVDKTYLDDVLDLKADKSYVSEIVLTANGNITNFEKEVDLLEYIPEQENFTAKALDTKKVWFWNGSMWKDTGLSELDLAKDYVDGLVNSATVVESIDINTIKKVGTYVLTTDKTFTNLPANLDFTEDLVLKIEPANTGFFKQILHKINSPNRVYRRVCRNSDGVGIWREPFNIFQRTYDAIDPTTIAETGTYVLTNGLNMPIGFSGSALVHVEKYGSFTERTVTQTADSSKKWKKIGTGSWVEAMPFALTNDRFPAGYNFRGLFTGANINTFNSEGLYLVNGEYTNGPSFFSGTIYIEVNILGAFRIQKATSSLQPDVIAQRFGSSSGSVWGDWQKIGGSNSGSSTGSSLNNKTIAFIGDSIVEQGDYPERIGERYSATIHKFGFGGCRAGKYASNLNGYDKQSLYNIAKCINTDDYSNLIAGAEYTRDNHNDDNTPQALAMKALDWNKVDILCIAFGTNDWTGNPVGTELIADETGATFKGAMCYSIEQIQSKYPHIQIVLIGMSFRLRTTTSTAEDNSDDVAVLTDRWLKDYQKAILEVAEKYHLPALDMYKNSGVNRYNYTHYLRDGIHPKAPDGNQHWANKIGSFLNSVI